MAGEASSERFRQDDSEMLPSPSVVSNSYAYHECDSARQLYGGLVYMLKLSHYFREVYCRRNDYMQVSSSLETPPVHHQRRAIRSLTRGS